MHHQSDRLFYLGIGSSVFLHIVVIFYYYASANASQGPKLKIDAVQTAVLVRKGEPRPKYLLPRIYKPRPIPVPRQRVVAKRDPVPPPRPVKPRRRRVSDDDLMERAMKRHLNRRSDDETDVRGDDAKPPGMKDGSDDGTVDDPSLVRAGNLYGLQIRRAIDRQKLPDLFSSQVQQYKRRLQLVIQIDKEGRLRNASVQQSSGNARFDAAVLACVRRAAPFPRPPDNIWKVIKDGIELGW